MRRSSSLLVCAFLLSACGPSVVPTPEGGLGITATFYPVAFLSEHIGGDHVGVTTIVPAGSEPHDFEPSPRDVATIAASDLFVWSGYGIDTWAENVARDRLQNNLGVVQSTKLVKVMPLAPGGEGMDPHVWLDPVLMVKQAEAIRDELIVLDPTNADLYLQNAAKLITQLSTLDTEFENGLQKCTDRRIVTSHDAFGYLAKRYNLSVLPIAGISPDEEPSAGRLAELTDQIKKEKIGTVFFETLATPKLAQTLAKETGAKTAVLNPLEGLTSREQSNGEDYFSVMRQNLEALRTALHCS